MTIRVSPILPGFGAEVSGIDIARPLDEATRRRIAAIQDRWGVTVWRDTGLDDAGHVAFSRLFGRVELAPRHTGKPSRMSEPELFDASNLDLEGNIATNESIRLGAKGNRLWHSDSSFMRVRSAQALLLCHEAPPHGGPTWFADTRGAYDDLPQSMKDRLEGLRATHSYFWSRRRAGYPYTEDEIDAKPQAAHPLVHVHAGSGRKALFVGAHTRDIVGMDRADGRALIDELIAWCTRPEYTFAVHYKPGDMTIWDNLCSLHRGGEYDDSLFRRDMRRTTVRDPQAPPAEPDHFTRMFADAGDTPFSPTETTRERVMAAS
ncbi:MAG: TauD/TfdA family dioxygenase [Novosphingobium sp.]|nr:TauD/TfdA family dioxygenase [Novosphingobium sp.]MBO9602220.1 TauD/TfdA family dioxygenase [Novosphingobium sp.]